MSGEAGPATPAAAPGLVAGVDGCRGGWVLAAAPVVATADDEGTATGRVRWSGTPVELTVIPDLRPLVAAIAGGTVTAAGIDMPIGLASSGPRRCDVEARRLLGPRRSSVFPAPARRVLEATTYEEACALSRGADGKGISRQLFNILSKIRELDAAMVTAPALGGRLFEMCPELSFAVMAGAPMAHPKRTAEGRAERLSALHAVFGQAGVHGILDLLDLLDLLDVHDVTTRRPPAGAAPDDVLDALAGLWTARRVAAGTALRFGGGAADETDETGLRMEIRA